MLRSELFTDDKVDLKVLKERALGMRWAGMPEGTIPLTSADPDFKPAIEIREAMTDFIKGGYFPYAPDALPGLREAISGSLKTRKNEDVPPEFIQPVDSASACMHAIALSVLKPGDEVIITNLWEALQYRVAEIQIIQPNEVEQILIKPGQELVTLLTCHPYASGGRQRYLVICERVDENS